MGGKGRLGFFSHIKGARDGDQWLIVSNAKADALARFFLRNQSRRLKSWIFRFSGGLA